MAKRGFTMIELLVVIVILGLLAGLIIPGTSKALTQAHFAQSQSNLRQIGVALMFYAQDHEGLFPIARGTLPYVKDLNSITDTTKWSWQMQLIPFTGGNEQIFRSTYASSFNASSKTWSYFLGSHAAGVEQAEAGAFNANTCPPLNLYKISAPAKHILAGECHSGLTTPDSDKDDYNKNNPAFGYGGTDHKVNILFADGHVESPKRFDPKKMAVKYAGIDPSYTAYQ